MQNSNKIAEAMKFERQVANESKDIVECSDDEKNTLRALLKEGLL